MSSIFWAITIGVQQKYRNFDIRTDITGDGTAQSDPADHLHGHVGPCNGIHNGDQPSHQLHIERILLKILFMKQMF